MREVSQYEFDQALSEAPGLVLVDFWADWCGPCKVVKPVLEAMSEQYKDRVAFLAVNADQNEGLMQAFGVRSLPTVLILRPNEEGPGAKVIAHTIGAQSASRYHDMIEKALTQKKGLFSRLFG